VTFIDLPSKVWAAGVVLAFTAINFLGSRLMGRAESVIVIIKVAILIVFIVAAFMALTGKGVVQHSDAVREREVAGIRHPGVPRGLKSSIRRARAQRAA
jgi:L-asparagine transporter-like permease